jgi:hypothetical protein
VTRMSWANCLSVANSWNRPCGSTAQAVGDDCSEVCRESYRTTNYCKGKVVSVHPMKAYRGSRGVALPIHDPASLLPGKNLGAL